MEKDLMSMVAGASGSPRAQPGGMPGAQGGVMPAAEFVPRLGEDAIRRAHELHERCKRGKQALDERVIANEEYYRLRYDRSGERREDGGEVDTFKTASAWLFNNLANKHADAMDNYPRPNLLPQEAGDIAEAELLSAIIPAILRQQHFEEVYSEVQWEKIKSGTGVYGVFWDGTASGGLGEIKLRHVDILNIAWDAGVDDLEESRNVFFTALHDREALVERYPQLAGELGGSYDAAAKKDYRNDDDPEKQNKVAVVDWYYKKWQGEREVLHLCQYCGTTILYASENDPLWADRGFYDHGRFPFVIDVLYPIKNSPAGFGGVDICRNPQEYIDRLDADILENADQGAKPRYFVPESESGVNEKDFLDMRNQIVKYAGNRPDSIVPIQTKPLDGIYVSVRQNKIDELKEISGNRDATTGGAPSGVTAASAIAAMIETGSKLSRDASRSSYRAFRGVVELMVELIRQFYTVAHNYRIVGEDGMVRFVSYSSQNIAVRETTDAGGHTYARMPLFDIEITAERSSPYTRMSQNELMIQLYGAGFFNPGNADASLAAIDGMAFDQKEAVRRRILRNGTLYEINQQLMMTNQVLAAEMGGGAIGEAVAEQNRQAAITMEEVGGGVMPGSAPVSEPAHMKRTKEQVAASTAPV